MKEKKALTLKTLNKSNVWDIQENDVFRMWEAAEKDTDLKDNLHHYIDVLKSAFDIEEIKIDKPEIISKYESRGFKIGQVRLTDDTKIKWAIKKRPIMRITDLTYENIHHITASKLIEVLERNFGGGWDSLPQSIQDIIITGFDISTTTLPQNRLNKAGGMYEKKVEDGFEVLEIPKGAWVEAIFAKRKPQAVTVAPHFEENDDDFNLNNKQDEAIEGDEELPDVDDRYNQEEEEDDTFDDEKLTEESYRTTFDESADELNLEAEDVAEDDDY